MKPCWHKVLIALSLAAALAAGAPAALAGDYGHYRSSHGYGQGYRHGYGHGYRPYYGHRRGWGYPYGGGYGWPGYWPGYGYGPGYGSLGLGYSSFGHHDSWGLSLALPLYFGPRYEPRPAYVPAPHSHDVSRTSYVTRAAPECVQTREYQTEITVGNEVLPAYGTACLQSDGSWKVISGPIVDE
jgi:hypothetical protein